MIEGKAMTVAYSLTLGQNSHTDKSIFPSMYGVLNTCSISSSARGQYCLSLNDHLPLTLQL